MAFPDTPPETTEGEPIRLPRWLNIVLGLFTFIGAIAAGIFTELADFRWWLFAIAVSGGLVSLFGKPLTRG